MRANQDIRDEVEKNGFRLWELAEAMGLYDGNLSRKLRRELPAEQKEEIRSILAQMVQARNARGGKQ